jgi:hypothetical protein
MFVARLRRWRAVLLTALLLPTAAHACINEIGTNIRGKTFETDWFAGGTDMTMHLTDDARGPVPTDWQLAEAVERARKSPQFAHLNDLGVVLIYRRSYARAIDHFLDVERRFPGRHQTAANLGTALELAGYDEVALRWIRIGIRRNQNEHQRSEWLHARILQAKIVLKRDPHYLDHRSVAGLDFSRALIPKMPAMPLGNDGRRVSPALLERSLSYQLFERTQFVKPKDPVVANLLMDWATLHLAGGSIENATALYDLAERYGAPRDALMNQRQARIRAVLDRDRDGEKLFTGDCAVCEPKS